MVMTKLLAALFIFTVAAPAAALADTSTHINELLVRQGLQDQIQNQLNTQSSRLSAQQAAARLGLQSQMQLNTLTLQQLQILQQIQLQRLRLLESAPPPKPAATAHP